MAMNETGSVKEGVRFFADSMLGKLARWMRVLGYDVEYEREIDDAELVRRAIKEDRIILTRDTLLVKRRRARGRSFFIESDYIGDQLKRVALRFKTGPESALTRCLRCNAILEDVTKEAVEGKVPPYVFKTQERFSICFACGRIYWAGTHKEKMLKDVERLLKG